MTDPWFTRELADAANAAWRAGLLPVFDDDDEYVSLRRADDDREVGILSTLARVSLYTDESDPGTDDIVTYHRPQRVHAALARYRLTGSFLPWREPTVPATPILEPAATVPVPQEATRP